MSDCERCNGDGEIETPIETLACPNCRDVCQWCNQPFEDGEPLGETGLAVCRPCIRDMARFKEDVAWSLYVSVAIDALVDDPEAFRAAIDSALADVFELHGLSADNVSGEWTVRRPDSDTTEGA